MLFMSPGAVGQEGYVNWEQVEAMHKAGWDIMPHGMTHPHLPELTAEKQKEEITEARRQIEERLGTTADVFCYPYGEFDKHTLTILQEEGFRYAFTIEQGMTTSKQHPFKLTRIYVNAKDSLRIWSRKLSP
jgi:peptidoglycan/xylan/chitin deacetylase (PgdA/CDA1 family)